MLDLMALGLSEGDLVLLDSSALVYLVEGASSGRRAAVADFLEAAGTGRLRLAISAIAWAELLSRPLASGAAALADSYRALLADSSRLYVACVDVAVAEEAARLAREAPGASTRPEAAAASLPDRLHIATAKVLGAAAVLTTAEAWRRYPGCPPVLLVDELAFGLDDFT